MAADSGCLRVCPIIAPQLVLVEQRLDRLGDRIDLFELWIEYFDQHELRLISTFLEKYQEKVILVSRRLSLDPPKLDQSVRREILALARNFSILVDFDITQQREELEFFLTIPSDSPSRLLLSFHQYAETPAQPELISLVDQMESYTPAIRKLATKCNSPRDALRLLELQLSLLEAEKRSVVLGMGTYGLPTRVVGPLWGAALTFLADSGEGDFVSLPTAPGQLTIRAFQELMELLRAREG